MEQQKILWIIFSVALFILVIVGVGVIWFLPSNHNTVAQASKTQSGNQAKITFDPYEWAKSQNSNYPGLENQSSGQGSTQGQAQGNGNFTIIYGQRPGETQSGSTSKQPTVSVSPKSTRQTTTATETAVAPKAAAPTTARPAPAPKPTTSVAPPRSRTVRVVQHWIQVASYTSDFRAEQAKKSLESNGITGKVMSRDVNGRTYFRVRVGPYLSQSEAEKFLDEIKKISEFRNSYISLVYASQRVN